MTQTNGNVKKWMALHEVNDWFAKLVNHSCSCPIVSGYTQCGILTSALLSLTDSPSQH